MTDQLPAWVLRLDGEQIEPETEWVPHLTLDPAPSHRELCNRLPLPLLLARVALWAAGIGALAAIIIIVMWLIFRG